MINYREIFNTSYNFIGVVLIIFIILLIVGLNRNLQKSFHQIGLIGLIASTITLVLSFLIKLIINQLIPYQYKLFIEVISENFFQYNIILSVVGIVISLLLLAVAKFFFTKSNQQLTASS